MSISSYNYNLHNTAPVAGSLMHYIGTSDPSGWLLCNGIARATVSDSRYSRLAAILNSAYGTSYTGNTITPPNLTSQFLCGTGYPSTQNISTTSTGIGNVVTNTRQVTVSNMPSHTHSFSGNTNDGDANHSHDLTNKGWSQLQNSAGGYGNYLYQGPGAQTSGSNPSSLPHGHQANFNNNATDNYGNNSQSVPLPPNTTFNIIIKY